MPRRILIAAAVLALASMISSVPVASAEASGQTGRVVAADYRVPDKLILAAKDLRFGYPPTVAFDSPDHNIQCFIGSGEDSGSYACSIRSHKWKWDFGGPRGHCKHQHYLAVENYTVEGEDTVLDCDNSKVIPRQKTWNTASFTNAQKNRVLPHDKAIYVGSVVCGSFHLDGVDRIQCSDTLSRSAFGLSSKGYTLYWSSHP